MPSSNPVPNQLHQDERLQSLVENSKQSPLVGLHYMQMMPILEEDNDKLARTNIRCPKVISIRRRLIKGGVLV